MMNTEMQFLWEQLEIMKIDCGYSDKNNQENVEKRLQNVYICYCLKEQQDLCEIDGSLICSGCGLVLEARIISEEAEWGNYANEDGTSSGANMNRCGEAADELTPSYSSYTEIRGSTKMNLLNKYLSINYKDKVMYHLKMKVKETLKANGLPETVCQESMLLYKKVTGSKDLFRGSNKTALLSACVYYVSKERGLGLSSAKISEAFEVQNKNFSKFYKYLIESGVCGKSQFSGSSVYKCSELVGRHCISLELPYKAVNISKKIAESIEELSIFPNSSIGSLLAGIILFVVEEMKLDIKKKAVAEICNTSESGMIKSHGRIVENKIIILNNAKK